MKSQVRAASRKWFARALMFLEISKRSPAKANEYLMRWRRQGKFADAMAFVLAARELAR